MHVMSQLLLLAGKYILEQEELIWTNLAEGFDELYKITI